MEKLDFNNSLVNRLVVLVLLLVVILFLFSCGNTNNEATIENGKWSGPYSTGLEEADLEVSEPAKEFVVDSLSITDTTSVIK